jgi:hypothetical protein
MTFYHCDQENCDYKTKYTKDTEIKYMYFDKEQHEDKIPIIVKSKDYDCYMRKLVI